MTEYRYKKCPVCGICYAVDEDVMAYKERAPASDKDRGWYCPNGHSLVFRESEADEQRRRAERQEQENARLRQSLDYQRSLRETAERSALK